MPEGPEVRIISDCLNDKISDHVLKTIKFLNNSKVYQDKKLFSSDYDILYNSEDDYNYIDINDTCYIVTSYGKKVCFLFNSFAIISSLNMEGRWSFKQDSNTSIILEFDSMCIYFKDIEKRANFGIVNYNSDAFNHTFKEVGYDLMDDTTTLDLFTEVIKNKRLRKKKIFEFILEQKYFSGIGMYLAPEIIYDSKLMYDRELETLTDDEINCLFNSIKKIMNESYKKGGLTIATYCDPYGRTGTYETKVYMKKITEKEEKVYIHIYQKSRKFYYCHF